MPRNWWDEVAILESKGLLSAEETVAIEAKHRELDPDQGEYYLSSFLDAGRVEGMNFGAYMLRRSAEEYAFCSTWHARRGRPQLAQRYQCMARVVRGVLEGG
jgi:hypothetical protein